MKILVAGGAGYIGSHTVIELLEAGHEVVVVDNLSNSSKESIIRVEKITGKKIPLHIIDVSDKEKLNKIFKDNDFDSVIHFAGLKAVGESVAMPLAYYRNNLVSTLTLCEVMQENDVYKLIFSSSATVYGAPESLPITEESATPAKSTNPYGQTKLMIEHILQDLAIANDKWQITILRYFNPVGAHISGLIGEDPNGLPNNLVPYISKVAVGEIEKLIVTGDDFDTKDGTGVRDYLHVVDLAKGHLAALEHMPSSGTAIYNLGTGTGYSVLEMIDAFTKACGNPIKYEVGPRRPGDIATCYCDPKKAKDELGWEAKLDLKAMCDDTWRWQSQNPKGYNI